MDFDEFADRFEKSVEEVLGEDVRKVSKTELAATLTYGDQNDKDNNIYYRILKTTFYEGGPEEITDYIQKPWECFSRLTVWTAVRK